MKYLSTSVFEKESKKDNEIKEQGFGQLKK